MPNSLIHYAVSAAVAHAVGLRGRERAKGALWGVAPDLDVITAIPWMLAAGSLPLDAGALIDGAYLLGHRGLSHTLLAGLVVGLLVAWRASESRWGWAAGTIWIGHVAMDGISPWPITPFWPFSTATFHAPVITGLDPLITLLSGLVALALLGPLVTDKLGRPGPGARERLRRFGERRGMPLVLATVVAIAASGATLATTALVQDVPLEDVQPAHFPRTVSTVAKGDGWTLTARWFPWSDGEQRFLPHIDDRTNRSLERLGNLTVEQAVSISSCTLPRLGPYAPIGERHAWIVEDTSRGLRVQGIDRIRNATSEGGPRLQFTFEGANLTHATLVGGQGASSWFQIPIPQPVVEAAECGRTPDA